MASSNINNGNLIRFEGGGIVRVWDATNTDDWNIFNIGPGTLQWTEGFAGRLPHFDRGAITKVKAGDTVPCEIDLDCSITDDINAFKAILDLGTDANGLIVTYRVDIELFKISTATVGPRVTIPGCYLRDPIRHTTGGTNAASSDMLQIRWGSITGAPTRNLWS